VRAFCVKFLGRVPEEIRLPARVIRRNMIAWGVACEKIQAEAEG